MPVVDLVIFGHVHRLTCSAGEEERLSYLADQFKLRVETAAKTLKTTDYRLVYLVAALTWLDEMEEKSTTSVQHEAEEALRLIRDKVLSINKELN